MGPRWPTNLSPGYAWGPFFYQEINYLKVVPIELKFSDIFKTQNRSSLPAPACSSLYAIYFSNLLYACVRYICPFSSLSVCSLFPDYKCRVTIRVIKCTPLRCHPSIVGCDEFAVLVVSTSTGPSGNPGAGMPMLTVP